MKTVRIGEYAGSETVIPADQAVHAELPGGFHQMADPAGRSEIRLLRGSGNQHAQMDLPAVQVEIAAVDGKFPETEFLGKKRVKQFVVTGKKTELCRIQIFGSIRVPQQRVIPLFPAVISASSRYRPAGRSAKPVSKVISRCFTEVITCTSATAAIIGRDSR